MNEFQCKYHGEDWKEVAESRMRILLSDHYEDLQSVLSEMEQGSEIRTTFATYRMVIPKGKTE